MYNRRRSGSIWLSLGVIVLLVVGFVGWNMYANLGTGRTVSFKVNDHQRVVTGSGNTVNSKYIIYTTVGVFEDVDTIWYLKYNSSDVFNTLEPGKTCTAYVYGWRVPFLSWYPNIVHASCK